MPHQFGIYVVWINRIFASWFTFREKNSVVFLSTLLCYQEIYFKKVLICLERTGLMDRKTWSQKVSSFASCRYTLASSPSIDNHFRTPRRKVVKLTNTSTWFSPEATYRRGVQLRAGLVTTWSHPSHLQYYGVGSARQPAGRRAPRNRYVYLTSLHILPSLSVALC
jgi:hypothetical protein